jgi:hypothetical protein
MAPAPASQNARRHALLARIVVLKNESPDGFAEVLTDHLNRFQPADGVEFGIVEEMVAAWWRMRRAWSIETRLLDACFDVPDPGDGDSLLAATFKNVDDSHGLALLHRYETRLHCIYQRGLRNLQLLRSAQIPNEPNPISEHLPVPEPPTEPLPAAPQVVDPPTPSQASPVPQAVPQPLVAQAFSLRCRHSWRHSSSHSMPLPSPPSKPPPTRPNKLRPPAARAYPQRLI